MGRVAAIVVLFLTGAAWAAGVGTTFIIGGSATVGAPAASVWQENTAAETFTAVVGSASAIGQRIDIASSFTLDSIDVEVAGTSGTIYWQCRIGKSQDLATYDEAWTGVGPITDGTLTLTSASVPSYTTGDNRLYFACVEESGSGSAYLSYSGDELTHSDTKRVFRTTGGVWNLNYADVNYDLRFTVYKK